MFTSSKQATRLVSAGLARGLRRQEPLPRVLDLRACQASVFRLSCASPISEIVHRRKNKRESLVWKIGKWCIINVPNLASQSSEFLHHFC